MRPHTLALLAGLMMTPAFAQVDLTDTTWLAEDIMGGSVVDRAQSTLQPLADGRVAGSGGCNRFTGKGEVNGGAVQIGLLATTRMACPPAIMDQEARFLKALSISRRYDLGADGRLQFYDAEGRATIRFSRLKS